MEVPPLATDSAGRKIWLVKVPAPVAARWRAACEASMNGDGGDGPGPVLGRIRVGADASSELLLEGAAAEGLPTRAYPLRNTTQPRPALLAFSETAGRAAAEGVVAARLEAEVGGLRRGGGGGGAPRAGAPAPAAPAAAPAPPVDDAYRQLARARTAAAARKRTVELVTEPQIKSIRGAGVDRARARGERPEKRVALDGEALHAALFRLFERQRHWAFAQLQAQTAQPTQHLRASLAEIAAQAKRGPYAGMWSLKPEYRTGGGGGGGGGAGGGQGDGGAGAV